MGLGLTCNRINFGNDPQPNFGSGCLKEFVGPWQRSWLLKCSCHSCVFGKGLAKIFLWYNVVGVVQCLKSLYYLTFFNMLKICNYLMLWQLTAIIKSTV